MPTSGAVNFTVPSAYDQANPLTQYNTATTIKGWLGDVYGTLAYVSGSSTLDANGNPVSFTYSFTRAATGTSFTIAPGTTFLADPSTINGGIDYQTLLFWILRNSMGLQVVLTMLDGTLPNAATQLALCQSWMTAAVKFLKPANKHFIILTELGRSDEYAGSTATVTGAALNGDQSYTLRKQINAWLQNTYPANTVPIDQVLRISGNGSTQDNADAAKDITPTSLRADTLHLANAGYAIVAQQVYNRIIRLGF
jgi:hypothetical protein